MSETEGTHPKASCSSFCALRYSGSFEGSPAGRVLRYERTAHSCLCQSTCVIGQSVPHTVPHDTKFCTPCKPHITHSRKHVYAYKVTILSQQQKNLRSIANNQGCTLRCSDGQSEPEPEPEPAPLLLRAPFMALCFRKGSSPFLAWPLQNDTIKQNCSSACGILWRLRHPLQLVTQSFI
jgi:hypothetical protein